MSKPEATSAKSLEEIIASIRKSLSGDGSGSKGASSRAERVEPELAPPAEAAAPSDGLLTDRLAGALNGAANGVPLDDDLSDILAQETKRSAPAKPTAAKSIDGEGERRDPPWFRSSGSTPENGPLDATGRSPTGDAAPVPPSSEPVTLSRPEVLRASLPPLFGEAAEHALPTRTSAEVPRPADSGLLRARTQPLPSPPRDADEASKPAVGSMFTARTHPSVPPPQAAGAMGKSETGGEARTGIFASLRPFETAMAAANTTPGVSQAASIDTILRAPVAAKPALGLETPVAPVAEAKPAIAPPADAELGDSVLAGEVNADAMAKTAPAALNAAAAPAARTLDQVVGELLEPVIRHWLENNLPRMVEQVVREEVTRAIAADRAAPKASD